MIGGRFVVIEGPNGVGKTTCADLVAKQLRRRLTDVVQTTEPSGSPLGQLVRTSEARLSGRAMALAVAADRYEHIDATILPALARGEVVVCDRYVQSSLVLQRLDGLALTEVWSYNAFVPPPQLSLYLHDDPDTIRGRLARRTRRSRLEQAGSPERELALYDDAFEFLAGRGWYQQRIDCRGQRTEQVAATVLAHIDRLAT
jgi:dTMP kinase